MTRLSTNRSVLALILFAIAGVPSTANSHHSFAMFDRSQQVSLKGVVRKIEWKNPHVYFLVEVLNPKGVAEHYTIEAGSINKLVRAGWKVNTLKLGESIVLTIHPIRTGEPGGMLVSITQADGTMHKG